MYWQPFHRRTLRRPEVLLQRGLNRSSVVTLATVVHTTDVGEAHINVGTPAYPALLRFH